MPNGEWVLTMFPVKTRLRKLRLTEARKWSRKAGSLAPELTLLIAIYLMLFLKNSAKWRLRQMTSMFW